MNSILEPDLATFAFAPSGPDDAYYDYCLEPYQPRRPFKHKFRSENLFWHALMCAGLHDALEPALRAVQRSLGPDLTVWGVKWDGTRIWAEIYVYDPQREDPGTTLEGLSETLRPFVQVTARAPISAPYVMVSFDLSQSVAETKVIPEANLYLTGENAHAGRSYIASEHDLELANTYRFFQAKPESDAILRLIKASTFMDFSKRNTLAKVVPPELFACKKICVAKKRRADAIYFSGVAVDQLRWFLERFEYPRPLIEMVSRYEARFEHLYFDVGIDYRWDPTRQELRYLKTSYYGTF